MQPTQRVQVPSKEALRPLFALQKPSSGGTNGPSGQVQYQEQEQPAFLCMATGWGVRLVFYFADVAVVVKTVLDHVLIGR